MMKTVIGLLPRSEDAASTINNITKVGFAEDEVRVLTNPHAVWEHLGSDQHHLVAKYAGWGALIGIAIYGPFGLAASTCECMFFSYSLAVGIGILFAFIVAGVALGAFIGSFVGAGELGNITHLYTEGVRRGGALMVVRTNDELVSKAVNILRQESVFGVKISQ